MNQVAKLINAHISGNVPVEYSNFTTQEREAAVHAVFMKEIGLEGGYTPKAFRKSFSKHKDAIYEIIESVVGDVKGLDQHPMFSRFVEIHNLDHGQTTSFIYRGRNNITVSETARNFSVKRQRVSNGQSFTVTPRTYDVAVYDMVDRLAAGLSTFEEMASAIREAVSKKLEEICYTALAQSLNNLPSAFVANGSYDENQIIDLVEKVESINQKPAILVGTRSALSRLQGKTPLVSNEQLNERARNGYVADWNGSLCVAIENIAKTGSHELLLPQDQILVLSTDDKPIRLVMSGSEVRREISGVNTQDNSMTLAMFFEAGVAVLHDNVIGKINLA